MTIDQTPEYKELKEAQKESLEASRKLKELGPKADKKALKEVRERVKDATKRQAAAFEAYRKMMQPNKKK